MSQHPWPGAAVLLLDPCLIQDKTECLAYGHHMANSHDRHEMSCKQPDVHISKTPSLLTELTTALAKELSEGNEIFRGNCQKRVR